MEVCRATRRDMDLIADGVMRHIDGCMIAEKIAYVRIENPNCISVSFTVVTKDAYKLDDLLRDINDGLGLCDSKLWYLYQFSSDSALDFLWWVNNRIENYPDWAVIEIGVATQDNATVYVRPVNEISPHDVGTTWRAPSGRLYVTEPFTSHIAYGKMWRMEGVPAAWELVQFVGSAATAEAEEMSNAGDVNRHSVSSEWFSYTESGNRAAFRLDAVIRVIEAYDGLGGRAYLSNGNVANLYCADFMALRQLLSLAWE